jgi:hypothetical protein
MTSEPAERTEQPEIVTWGRRLLGTCVVALGIGGATVKILGLRGRGLDAAALAILIPIWAAGIAGLLLLLVAWVLYPALYDNRALTRAQPARARDEHSLGPFTQGLILFALILFWFATLALLLAPDDPNPLWLKGLILYVATCYCAFMVYLMAFYRDSGHDASTTYWQLLTPPLAFILIPLTWPLAVVLNVVVASRRRAQRPHVQGDDFGDDGRW